MVDELGLAVVFVNDVDKVSFDKTSIKMSKSSLCLIPERDEKEKHTYKDVQSDLYPHTILKKQRGYCNRLPPSVCLSVHLSVRPYVCPLCYLLLNHWTKFNQIWCESY